MTKSSLSPRISDRITRSVRIWPRDGFVLYQSSTSVRSFGSFSTLHSAQPASSRVPPRTSSRMSVKTVPVLTIVGGVPQRIVCGFREAETI